MKESVPRRSNNFCLPSLAEKDRQGLALWNLSILLREIAKSAQNGSGHQNTELENDATFSKRAEVKRP